MTNDEVNRWKLSAERIAELRGFIDQLLSTHNMYECIAIRDMLSEEITHEPCERHRWKPGMWNVYYVRSDGQERPALSAETAEGAANALRQDAADLVRVIESEGASRDASSTGSSLPPTQHVAGGWGYSCTEAVRCSHGKVDGECLVIPCAHYGQKT